MKPFLNRSAGPIVAILAGVSLLTPGCTTSSSSTTAAPGVAPVAGAGAMNYQHDQVKKLVVLVQPVRSRGGDLAGVIDAEFLTSFLAKGYDVVTRESLDAALRELKKRGDEAYDVSTAAEVGKLVQASHVLLVKVPVITATQSGNKAYPKFTLVAQIVEVETGLIRGVVQDENRWADKAPIAGGSAELTGQIQRVARRVASRFP
jgi:hypothetical protein